MLTGGGQNAVGEVEEEQLVILAADKELTNSATERVTQMLGGTPAFAGITGAVDLFKPTSSCPPEDAVEQNSLVLESSEQEVVTSLTSDGSRKRKHKRSNENSSIRTISAQDLLPLQQEVLWQQMAVFSAQLALINEQREYIRIKKQKLLEKSDQ